MHIGFITACYHPVVNGVTHCVALQEETLRDWGHRVTVFAFGRPVPGENADRVLRTPALPLGRGYSLAEGLSREAQRRLEQVDLIHCHHLAMGLDLARRYASCPIVFTNHSRYDLYAHHHIPLPGRPAQALMRLLWPRLAGRADVVISPSQGLSRRLCELGLQRPVRVVPNGIKTRRFQRSRNRAYRCKLGLDDRQILCVFVGRLAAEKNVDFLIRQFDLAAGRNSDLHLLLVGDGPQRRSLTRLAKRLASRWRIGFAGVVPPAALPEVLAAADLFVSASQSEVLPLTAIEAQAAGLPIIALNAPGFDEIVAPQITGLLCEAKGDGLARAIVDLAADRDMRQGMGAAARAASAHFDLRRTQSQTIDLYRRLLSSAARVGRDRLQPNFDREDFA